MLFFKHIYIGVRSNAPTFYHLVRRDPRPTHFYHLVRQVFQVGHPKDLGSIHRWVPLNRPRYLPVGSSRPLIGQSVRSSCPYRCHFGTNIHLVDHLSIRCIHLLQEGILAATLHYSLDRLQYLPTHRATSSWVTSSQRLSKALGIRLVRIHILTRSDRSIDSEVTSFGPLVASNTLGPPACQVKVIRVHYSIIVRHSQPAPSCTPSSDPFGHSVGMIYPAVHSSLLQALSLAEQRSVPALLLVDGQDHSPAIEMPAALSSAKWSQPVKRPLWAASSLVHEPNRRVRDLHP